MYSEVLMGLKGSKSMLTYSTAQRGTAQHGRVGAVVDQWPSTVQQVRHSLRYALEKS
jgi:hypothetical protein